MKLTIDDIEKAAKRLTGIAECTPLQINKRLSKKYHAQIFMKREDLQEVRSFKIRGAYNKMASLSAEEKKLLADLKAIKPLTVTLFLKGETEDKILGTGLFLGDNKVVIASIIAEPKEGELYIVKSVLGEQKVSKVIIEKDFTIVELVKTEVPVVPVPEDITTPPAETTP